eukprot:213257_1
MASLFLSFLLYSSLSSAETKIYTSTNYIFVEVGVSNELSHTDANIACFTSYNTSLATIKTEQEQNEVKSLINGVTNSGKWIGIQIINSSSIWMEDGSSAQLQISATWHPSSITLMSDDNKCVAIRPNTPDGQWDTWDCTGTRDYICNRYPPTINPTITLTMTPTLNPSITPTTNAPTTYSPTTLNPTINPSMTPTTNIPTTNNPTITPTVSPTMNPTMPSHSPTKAPTLPNGETLEKTTDMQKNKKDLMEKKGDTINITLILLIIFGILLLGIGILIGVYCNNKHAKNNLHRENISNVTVMSDDNDPKSIEMGASEIGTIKSESDGEDSNEAMYHNNKNESPNTTTPYGNTANDEIDLENGGDSSSDNAMYENGEIEQTQGMTDGITDMNNDIDINNNNLGFYAVALNKYIAIDNDQLDFKENDIFYILETLESGWWFGYDKYGNNGWFPSNYLRKCDLMQQNELKQK